LAICPTLEPPEQGKINISVGSHKHLSSIFQSPFFTSPSSGKGLFDPLFDLIHFGNFSRYLHHSVNNQSRSYQHTIIGNGFDILNLDHLSLNAQFFNCIPSSLRELIAFCSPHPQNFNLFHHVPPPYPFI
jgi:hypothetical protein